jgi:hypothetical protein
MNELESARQQFRPQIIKYLLIAEFPREGGKQTPLLLPQ